MSGHLRQGCLFRVWWFSGLGAVRVGLHRCGPALLVPACACVCRGWWVLHTRACSVSVGTAESCGTVMSVAGAVLLPCATPRTSRYHLPRPAPRSVRFSSTNSTSRRARRARGRRPHATHLGTVDEQQTRGVRPISTRVTTDLAAEYDRSRCGDGPISAKGCAGPVRVGQGQGRSGPARVSGSQWLSGASRPSRATRSASRS